jgi:hypothetical protein
VYPDAEDVDDPFRMQRVDKVVTRAIHRAWPMRIDLPDLGPDFAVHPVTAGNAAPTQARDGRFTVRPGVYVLSAGGPVDPATLPARIGRVGFGEFHVPPPDPLPTRVVHAAPPQHLAGRPVVIEARVVADERPDSVRLWIRPLAPGGFQPFPMEAVGAYGYRATLPAGALPEGPAEYVVSVHAGDSTLTFPEGVHRAPSSWDFSTTAAWRTAIVSPGTPLALFHPADDAGDRMSFSRIGDGYRQGIFRIVTSAATGEPAFHLELPVNVDGIDPDDYTAQVLVPDRIATRGETLSRATGVRVRLRGIGPRQRLHLTMMESDGTSWSAAVEPGPQWEERVIPLSAFRISRGVKLPQGYPGTWNYWVGPAAGRGGPGDALNLPRVERLQLSLRREPGFDPRPGSYGVEVESVTVVFD